VLRPEGGGKENGLRAEYFANKNFSGKPSLSRVEERGYFVWDMQDPSVLKAAPRQSFSLRWSASVQVNQSGDYEFGLVRAECHSCGRKNAARLYIEGQLLVDDSQQVRESMYPKTGRVHLEAGKPRNIRAFNYPQIQANSARIGSRRIQSELDRARDFQISPTNPVRRGR
jgi:hypothetical protein